MVLLLKKKTVIFHLQIIDRYMCVVAAAWKQSPELVSVDFSSGRLESIVVSFFLIFSAHDYMWALGTKSVKEGSLRGRVSVSC